MHKNMYYKNLIIDIFAVTFRKEGVDWNRDNRFYFKHSFVTFRKEGVDWNICQLCNLFLCFRHLPQGRCGLKSVSSISTILCSPSPSARKVWIEIKWVSFETKWKYVTFRKEGVDWNMSPSFFSTSSSSSPSARKVWIEIAKVKLTSVTRKSHLPQGRCGLK